METDGDGDGIADEEDGCPTIAGQPPTGCPDLDDNLDPLRPAPPTTPTTVPQEAAVQERWNIYFANSTFPFAISRTGDTFSGTGVMPNIGPVQVSGSLARSNVHIAVQAPGGMVYNGPATYQRSPNQPQHFDLGFNGWVLHINH
jgi:hypothetical protein